MELERFPNPVLARLHDPDKSNQTEVAYRLAWARTYLKKYGLFKIPRGGCDLNQKANELKTFDSQEVVHFVRALDKKQKVGQSGDSVAQDLNIPEVSQEEEWKQQLHIILTQKLSPPAFERLVQRI